MVKTSSLMSFGVPMPDANSECGDYEEVIHIIILSSLIN